ncbi:MAG TPA: Uma2 family endonuclease [Chloroflexia bacterium]|jgi:Uma2 family endonuclease
MAMRLPRRHFTVDEYHKMGEAGILHEDDRVELIDGEIIEMSPVNHPHILCVDMLTKLLVIGVGDDAMVRVQSPIRLDDATEPQPDLALMRPYEYLATLEREGPEDVLLVIEVAESTIRADRNHKVPRYARAGIPEVWLVNIPKKVVEVYSDPAQGKYQSIMRVGRGQSLTVKMLPHVHIAVDAFLR